MGSKNAKIPTHYQGVGRCLELDVLLKEKRLPSAAYDHVGMENGDSLLI